MGIAATPRSKADEAIRLLNQYTTPFYGFKGNAGPRPIKVQQVWERFLKNDWSLRIPNYKLDQHFNNQATFYFVGASAVLGGGDYTLFMVDIDVLKSKGLGTPEGALAFAQHLKATLLPGMFFEVSTNGKGIQGFCLFYRRGLTDEQVNEYLKHIEQRLRQEQAKVNADIELVEIKGSIPIIDGAEYKVIKSGSLAKFPRTIRDRLDEFKNTTVVSPDTLQAPAWNLDKNVKQVVVGGSTFVLPEDYEQKLACYERLALAHGLDGLSTKTRAKVTARDFAIFFLLGSIMKYDPQKGMPTRRWECLWTGLHKDGVLDRGFDCHRFKIMRDTMSERGLIQWFDEHYRPPVGQKGQCCRWRFSDDFLDALDAAVQAQGEHTHNIVGTDPYAEIELAGPHATRYPTMIFQQRPELPFDYEERLEWVFAAQAA